MDVLAVSALSIFFNVIHNKLLKGKGLAFPAYLAVYAFVFFGYFLRRLKEIYFALPARNLSIHRSVTAYKAD